MENCLFLEYIPDGKRLQEHLISYDVHLEYMSFEDTLFETNKKD